ncbi:MAG: hypothetical protein FWF70_08210 [Bacteroidetes bacterium]|nr:hypothetical protein [Bacteroidota bacterium]MCL1968235.1 hypothetical protein [Bacteroidota bacterium]
MTKKRLFIFIFFIASLKCFSQGSTDIYVNVVPMRDCKTTIPLQPAFGMGPEANLLVTFNWDNNIGQLKMIFYGDSDDGLFVYAFPKKQPYSKAMKEKDDVWFDKDMVKKYMKDKKVVPCINESGLVNVILDGTPDVTRTLELRDPESRLIYYFKMNAEDCKIPVTLYVASKNAKTAKSPRDKKVEYLVKFTLNILTLEVCESPELKMVISYLDKETEKLLSQKDAAAAALDQLYDLPSAKIKELQSKTVGTEEKFTGTKDQQYNECDNLKASIARYNGALEDRNNTILIYNTILSDKKQKGGGGHAAAVDCRVLYQINEKLTELLLDIKNSKQSTASLKQKYDRIKSTINADYKTCKKEYGTFTDLCTRIENRLK